MVPAAILSEAFLAAAVAAAINIRLARRKSRQEERNKLRTTFAEAFAAHSAYKEFPYAIRRRRPGVVNTLCVARARHGCSRSSAAVSPGSVMPAIQRLILDPGVEAQLVEDVSP